MAQESRGQPRREQFKARMVEQLGTDQAAALDEALRSPAPERRALRLNPLKGARREDFEAAGFKFLENIPWEPNGYWVEAPGNLDSNPLLGAGLGYIQEAGAMEVVSVLDPKPGEYILDLCAAPGSKSTQILERLGNDGWLVCNDPVRARAEKLNALTAKHGSARVSVLSQDPDSLLERYESVFDRVLVDAPSSSESFFGKPGDKRLDVPDAEVAGCARRQYLILDRAAQMCRAGGVLVYSTNTYSAAENSDLIKGFLESHPDFELEKEQYRFPHIDKVPGGYWAKLVHTGEAEPNRVAGLTSVSGLLRQGIFTWKGEVDQYALAMLADGMSPTHVEGDLEYPVERAEFSDRDAVFVAGSVELNEADARSFLGGNALRVEHAKGLCVVTYLGHAIGLGKSTGDRINNLLPKILRALR